MYDFIIVGGGILGLSTAMQLKQTYPDKRMLLVDKEDGPARHQTGHNSGVIHAGVYYAPGSLKSQFCTAGNRETKAFCDEENIPYDVCGKLLVATNETELTRMQALWERTAANGVEREWVSREALHEREPNVTGVAGIFVPSSGIVDYRNVAAAMARRFEAAGGDIRYGTRVTGLRERTGEVNVETDRGGFNARHLVTCSGLMSDRIVRMLGLTPDFIICPFRGEYYRLAPRHNKVVNHLIYPIPDPSMPFLGVHLTRMIDGSVTVGPNAVLALKREGYRKTDFSLADTSELMTNRSVLKVFRHYLRPGLREFRNSIFRRGYLAEVQKYCPDITLDDLEPYPAGVRAQAISRDGKLMDDFLFMNTRRTVNVCNAPSPAATSALPIGRHIVEKVQEQVG